MNENQDLRRKLHEQRTEMQQLKSWKTMARKKYLEQIKEIRDDVQELQSRSRINQFKFQQLNKNSKNSENVSSSSNNGYDREHHDVEVIQNNYESILNKFNQVQKELTLIINSY